jgi:hypothetical protein
MPASTSRHPRPFPAVHTRDDPAVNENTPDTLGGTRGVSQLFDLVVVMTVAVLVRLVCGLFHDGRFGGAELPIPLGPESHPQVFTPAAE